MMKTYPWWQQINHLFLIVVNTQESCFVRNNELKQSHDWDVIFTSTTNPSWCKSKQLFYSYQKFLIPLFTAVRLILTNLRPERDGNFAASILSSQVARISHLYNSRIHWPRTRLVWYMDCTYCSCVGYWYPQSLAAISIMSVIFY